MVLMRHAVNVKLSLNSLHQQAPLHVAARSHNAGTANYLGDKGADVNIRDDSGVSEWG